jgi:hypothetical protein
MLFSYLISEEERGRRGRNRRKREKQREKISVKHQ